jgi:dTMP kinase
MFITFEGGEGAGKTTLIEGLAKLLSEEGHSVIKTREPGGTELGEEVRVLLLQSSSQAVSPYAELALFLASRAQHIQEVIEPALKAGKVVLCDRYNDSSIAYQGSARGLGLEKVREICHFFCHGVEPNLTLYLDIDPKIGLARAKKARAQDRIEAEDIAFHERIRRAYHQIQKMEPKRLYVIDADLAPERVLEAAMKKVRACLEVS